MRKPYEAPVLICDEYVPDTMIASAGAKNRHADVNQNCWGCRYEYGAYDPFNNENDCLYIPGDGGAYTKFC